MYTSTLENIKTAIVGVFAAGLLAALVYFIAFPSKLALNDLIYLALPLAAATGIFIWRLCVFNIRPSAGNGPKNIRGSLPLKQSAATAGRLYLNRLAAEAAIQELAAIDASGTAYVVFDVKEKPHQFVQFAKNSKWIFFNWPYVQGSSSDNRNEIQAVASFLYAMNYKQVSAVGGKGKAKPGPKQFMIEADGLYANVGIDSGEVLVVLCEAFQRVFSYKLVDSPAQGSFAVQIESFSQ